MGEGLGTPGAQGGAGRVSYTATATRQVDNANTPTGSCKDYVSPSGIVSIKATTNTRVKQK